MIDVNCLVGNWPFYKLREKTFSDLRLKHEKHNILGGYVASLDSLFYRDPYEGDVILAKELKNTNYEQLICVNPNLPYFNREFKKANNSFDYAGIRVYPTIHKYDIKGSPFDELMHMTKENNKKLFISARVNDARMDYLLLQDLLDISSLASIINNKYNLEVCVLNLRFDEIRLLEKEFKKGISSFDSSDIKHEPFAMDELKKMRLEEKCQFGSFFPLYSFESSYMIYTKTGELNG